MSSQIIKDALRTYDETQDVIKYIATNTTSQLKVSDNELERGKIILTNKTTGEVELVSDMEILGSYYSKYNLWTWSWAQPQLIKPYSYMTRKALQYALDLEPNKIYLKSILSLSRGIVTHPLQVDINVAVCSFLIKQPYILPTTTDVEDTRITQYIILIDTEAVNKLKKKILKDN